MSRPIVVGVDGSPTAHRAATKARDIALSVQSPLHVVSAHAEDEITHVGSGSDRWIVTSSDNAQRIADQVAGELYAPDLEIVPTGARGKPAEALIAYAECVGAEMIVVGNQRMRGITRVLGSVANSVSHNATCDVYIANTYEN